jgi:uncharacterized membrane protein YfhO
MFPLRPAGFGFRMALEDDTDQTALRTSTEFFRAARDAMLTRDWQPSFLRMANVRYVVEFLPLDEAQRTGSIIWFRDLGPSPRYSFNGEILRIEEKPSRIRLDVSTKSESFLVASVTRHKYWRATIDGREAKILAANIGFQGLFVPAGRHSIEFRYRNPLILPSAMVSIITFLIVGAGCARPRAAAGRPY